MRGSDVRTFLERKLPGFAGELDVRAREESGTTSIFWLVN